MDIRRIANRWVAGSVGLIAGAAIAWGAATLTPSQYQAHTDVLLTPAADARAADVLHGRLLGSYALMLDSRTVAESVHSRTGDTASVASIEAGLSGSVVDDTSVLRATVRHKNPQTAAALSDAAAASLIDLLADRGIAATSDTASSDAAPAATDTGTTWSVRASIMEDAAVPQRATSPTVPGWVAVGALAGLLFGLAVATLNRSTGRSRGRRSAPTRGPRRQPASSAPGRHCA